MNSIVIIGVTNCDSKELYIDHIVLEDNVGWEYPLYWDTFCWSEGKDKNGHSVISATGCYIPSNMGSKYSDIIMDRIMDQVVKFYPVYKEEAPEDYEFILEELDYCSNVYANIVNDTVRGLNEKIKEIGGKPLDIVRVSELITKEIGNPFISLKIHNEINNGEEK